MQKFIYTIFLFLWGFQFVSASDSLQVSVYTCSPGKNIEATFGHTAIHIVDKVHGTDRVYNFGMFDFDTPYFGLKFIQGELLYMLEVQTNKGFLDIYKSENRWVAEQKLNLTDWQKQDLKNRLTFLHKPENRYYLYKFLYRNCATEVRNLLLPPNEENGKLIGKTYRMLVNEYLEKKYWTKFGINLIMGPAVDKEASAYESMFLPLYLQKELNKAEINGQKLVASEKIVLPSEPEKETNYWFCSPLVIFGLISLVILFAKSTKLEMLFLIIWGLLGVVLVFISFSAHHELHYNFNLLWCNPLYLLWIPLRAFVGKTLTKYLSYFLLFCLLAVVVIWIVGLQACSWVYIPVVLALFKIMIGRNFKRVNKKGLSELNG